MTTYLYLDFVKDTELIPEDDVPLAWSRVKAECSRCGEKRLVWWACPMRQLNAGDCTPPPKPKISQRFFGLFR